MPTTSMTHRIFKVTTIDHLGKHDAAEVAVHVSRTCKNCSSFASNATEEWDVNEYGPCLNLCSTAEESGGDATCPAHQTEAEFQLLRHRPSAPVLTLLQGGAAA